MQTQIDLQDATAVQRTLQWRWQCIKERASLSLPSLGGVIEEIKNNVLIARMHGAVVGDLYQINLPHRTILAQVVVAKTNTTQLVPLSDVAGLSPGLPLTHAPQYQRIWLGEGLRGRVINAYGMAMDGGKPPWCRHHRLVSQHRSASPLQRAPIHRQLITHIRAIDALLGLGYGQRVGIFAAAGVGKTTLLQSLWQHCAVDTVVLALVGERGREVQQTMEIMRKHGLEKRTVVVAATSERPASERLRAAFTAQTIAEYFAESGHVLLLFDSLTRICQAAREIALSSLEPPSAKGYPPSVFSMLPSLIERSGAFVGGGSISAMYSVLLETDNQADSLGEVVRGLLDGHLVLSRSLAEKGHFPAIDTLRSLSRLAPQVQSASELRAAQTVRQWLSVLSENQDLLQIGSYQAGSNPLLDQALKKKNPMEQFLQQDILLAPSPMVSTLSQLHHLCQG